MRSLRISCACLLLCAAAQAAPGVAEEPDAAPDVELLEFLGEWETDEGELVDPLSLDHDLDPGGPGQGASRSMGDRARRGDPPAPGEPGRPRTSAGHEDDVDATVAD